MKDERVKRFRTPKLKDGELRMYFGRLPGDCPDIIYAWQGDSSMRRDCAMLQYHTGSQRPDPSALPLYSKMLPSLLKDLEARGYDLATLHFSIMKKAPNA